MTIDQQIQEQLRNAIETIRPYAMAQGRFHDINDLRAAIRLALQFLARAQILADRRLPPKR
jgi:hypothetical protein